MAGVGLFAKYVFSGLTRKRRVFERSVLVYVSIKNATLTPSGRKRRVCVNQPDGLTHPAAADLHLLPLLLCCLFYLAHPVSPGCILPFADILHRSSQNQADSVRVKKFVCDLITAIARYFPSPSLASSVLRLIPSLRAASLLLPPTWASVSATAMRSISSSVILAKSTRAAAALSAS